MEEGILCAINGDIFHLVTMNMSIGDKDAGFYDITATNELVQGIAGNMSGTKKGKL